MTTVSGPFGAGAPDADGGVSLPTLSQALETLASGFDTLGTLGLLAIDASFLAAIERRNGDAARRAAYAALSRLVLSVCEQRLHCDDLMIAGETGRNEIWIAFLREAEDASLARDEIPGFEAALLQTIQRNGGKAFYPHLRQAPTLVTGYEIVLRNPRFSPESQIFGALEMARESAALNEKVRARARRGRFQQMLLDRDIYSVFEPIVEVGSHTVFGYESLVRGPEDSEFHSPAALFGAADEYDMVFELDCLCRRSGLKGAIDFPEGTKLFLNILPTAFHDPNFHADRLIQTLEQCRLSPSDVVFEISEQESIENFSVFKEARDEFRTLGFQFALDDTGSGYAGLEALLEISPEFIKMDRAFVSGVDEDPARQDLLAALLTLAEKMGARVIGEGLDTLEELEMLRELGIHFGQGWLFGHPTPLRARD